MDYTSDNQYVYQYCLLSPAFFVTPVNLKTVLSQPENKAKYDDSATTMCGSQGDHFTAIVLLS